MNAALNTNGLIHAEALSFALTDIMPRPEAQDATKTLCQKVIEGGGDLGTLALQTYPDLDASIFQADAQMGLAPQDARAFVAKVKAL
jgi:3-carboxy-cis,cis-muconate cycloisomerase